MLVYNGKNVCIFLIFIIYNLTTYKNDLKWKTVHYKHATKPNSKTNHVFKIKEANKVGKK